MTADFSAPPPFDLPDGLRSPSDETQRAAIAQLADQADWTAAEWPALLESLLRLGRTDIPLSRLTEGHVDALRIMAEAGHEPERGALYGVWASRSGGTGLTGEATDSGWRLSGNLLFASGAGILDRALVTVWPEGRDAVLIDADVRDWPFDTSAWHTRAMEHSRSYRLHLDGVVAARQVGDDGFYHRRWSFFPGGVGVAAVWTGGAARVLDLLTSRRFDGDAKRLRLGAARTELATAVALVRHAGRVLASGSAEPQTVSTLCRAGVAAAIRRLLDQTRILAGPAGLAFDEPLTRAVDDLALYVAQQSPDGDALFLGDPG